ncbi:MAG: hypothetical protein ACREJ2_07230 [Planctomycetota bacterium]
MTTNEKRQAREAKEAAKCADYRDDIGALLDLVGQQVSDSQCSETLADIRSALKELVAKRLYTANCSEAEVHTMIEENLTLLREVGTKRVEVIGANGQKTTVSIPNSGE